MFLGHNCAPWEATKRSYELFAEHVVPALRGANVNRTDSLAWANANSGRFIGAMLDAIVEASAKHLPTQ